jgi:quercetin dioxygenase-like cupin family protein
MKGEGMESVSLTTLAEEQLEVARTSHSGRAAQTIHGGHDHLLRQTLIALAAGHGLGEHTMPGQATLQVLRGRVRLCTADDEWMGTTGDYLVIPRERHSLHADGDAVVLLTVLADS